MGRDPQYIGAVHAVDNPEHTAAELRDRAPRTGERRIIWVRLKALWGS